MDIILKDTKDFDPKVWLYAVTLSVSAVLVLGLSMCFMLLRDHYLDMEEKRLKGNNYYLKFLLFIYFLAFKMAQ